MQSHRWMRLLSAILLPAAAFAAAGCETGRLQQERQALWVQNQELQDELNRTRAALDAAEADRLTAQSQISGLQDRLVAPQAMTASANSAFAGIEGVETVQTPGQIAVRVPGDVLFEPGKVTLKESAKRTLNQVAQAIKREYPGNTIRVEGYTDTDPIRRSNWADNLELSLQRAAAVHRYLAEQGVDADRMYAAGFGAARPQATKAKSRRVEIVVVLAE